MVRTRSWLAVCAVAASVCLTQLGESRAQEDLSNACAEMQAGTPPVCTKLHATGTALRLPADGDTIYGAVTRGTKFVTVSGRRLAMTDAVRTQIESGYATTVYEAGVAGDRVTELRPVLSVRSDTVMERIFGSRLLVGRISARTSPRDARFPSYSGRPTLPIVVEVARAARGRGIRGTILNAGRAVRVGKRCLPALSRHARNPLVKRFTRRIALERHPSMHVPFEDTLVLAWSQSSSGMGAGFYPSLATLFGRDDLGRRWHVTQHGSPFSGPALSLRFARPGARARRCR